MPDGQNTARFASDAALNATWSAAVSFVTPSPLAPFDRISSQGWAEDWVTDWAPVVRRGSVWSDKLWWRGWQDLRVQRGRRHA